MKKITDAQFNELIDYFDFVDGDWVMLHTKIGFDDASHTVTVSIEDVDEHDYEILKLTGG
jgi:hypothetical protein